MSVVNLHDQENGIHFHKLREYINDASEPTPCQETQFVLLRPRSEGLGSSK